ncbi:MAG: hypothetical protein QM831_15005 [Kofleriaceae bacterium]
MLSETESASTVNDYSGGTNCSTAVVIGLSKQIADEAGCENPASFVSFQGTANVTLASNAVLPYLVKGASDDLKKVAAGNSLTVTSALRSIAQQYLLYHWYLEGRCGITAAATVGHSNHEGGRAVDLSNYSSRISAMAAHGWAHDVAGDPVHFDHTASPDERGQDTAAFQRLWNRNHPEDLIAEDGDYGPETEARLKKAPATGFAIGPSCKPRDLEADVVSVMGPDKVPPMTTAHYTIVIQNGGAAAWPATTKMEIASGDSSPLHDDSWMSATVVAQLGAIVDTQKQTTVDFDVTTPAATEDTPITQVFQLDDSGTNFGTINLALTVSPDADMNTSGDGNDEDAGDGANSGGCNVGGGAGWVAGAAGLMLRRRKRR